jgi:hypothetical protein
VRPLGLGGSGLQFLDAGRLSLNLGDKPLIPLLQDRYGKFGVADLYLEPLNLGVVQGPALMSGHEEGGIVSVLVAIESGC